VSVAAVCGITLIASVCAAGSDFWFVQITDTHWGVDDNLIRTRKAVAAIGALPVKIAFVLHTGDAVDRSAPDRLAALDSGCALLGKIACPVHYAAGNNDIRKKNFAEDAAQFRKRFGGGARLIVTPEAVIITWFDFPVGEYARATAAEPLDTLDSLLRAAPKNLPVIVFQHFPVADDFYDGQFHPDWSASRRDRFVALCESHRVAAVICGHFHRDELHRFGTLSEFVAAPVAAKKGRQASLRLYHYENGAISYFTGYF
jgi:3',5'-cyclic AMP phosphodiesterase CpdA